MFLLQSALLCGLGLVFKFFLLSIPPFILRRTLSRISFPSCTISRQIKCNLSSFLYRFRCFDKSLLSKSFSSTKQLNPLTSVTPKFVGYNSLNIKLLKKTARLLMSASFVGSTGQTNKWAFEFNDWICSILQDNKLKMFFTSVGFFTRSCLMSFMPHKITTFLYAAQT